MAKEKIAEEITGKWKDWERSSAERRAGADRIERLYRAGQPAVVAITIGGASIPNANREDAGGSQGAEMFRAIEVDTAKINEILHPDPLRFFATEVVDEDESSKTRSDISDRMVYRLRNDNFPSKSVSLIRSACLFGNMIGAVMRHPVEDTATIRIINWRDLASDPLAPSVADSRWIIERSFIDEATLKSRSEGEGAIYNPGAVSKILRNRNKKKDDPAGPTVGTSEDGEDQSIVDAGFSRGVSGRGIEILDYWLVGGDGEATVSTVSANDAVALRNKSESPFEFSGHNYFGAPLISLFGRSEGIGIGEATASMQDTINRNRSAMIHLIDHALLNIWGKLDEAKIKYSSIKKMRDKVIKMKVAGGLFSIIPDLSPIQVAIAFEQLIKDELRQKSAAIDSKQGPTNEPTLGQAVISRDEAASRHVIYAQNIAAGYERMLWLFWKVLTQFDTKPVRVPSTMPGIFTDIVPSTVSQDVRFSIDITSPRRNPQARLDFLSKALEFSVKPEAVDEEGRRLLSSKELAARFVRASGEPQAEALLGARAGAAPGSKQGSLEDILKGLSGAQGGPAPQIPVGAGGNGVPIV